MDNSQTPQSAEAGTRLKRTPRGRLCLTPRDYLALNAILDYGIITTEQLRQKIFGTLNIATILRRLRKLRRHGYIISKATHKNGKLIWYVLPKGARQIEREVDVTSINRNTLDHDLTVNDLRLLLEQSKVTTKWTSGYQLKRKFHEGDNHPMDLEGVPDGSFEAPYWKDKTASLVFHFEVELVRKSNERYRHAMYTHGEKDSVARVWYAVPNEKLGEVLMERWKAMNSRADKVARFAWSLIDDIKKNPRRAILHSANGTYRLDQLVFFEPKIGKPPAHPTAQAVSTQLPNSSPNKVSEVPENTQNTLATSESKSTPQSPDTNGV